LGQERDVQTVRIVAKDTIEENILALQARKAELANFVLDKGKTKRKDKVAEQREMRMADLRYLFYGDEE
jgi:SNF2 family DNA or RNA helicase